MSAFCLVVLCYLTLILALSSIVPHVAASINSERGIFRLHLGSVAVLASGLLVYFLLDMNAQRSAEAAAALAAHAIVSMTFLEIWSLAQGGYSLQMLLQLRERPSDAASLVDRFAVLGDEKRQARLASLEQLALIQVQEGRLTLTPRGTIAGAVLAGLLFLVNIKGNA